jgi:hypothetical protein
MTEGKGGFGEKNPNVIIHKDEVGKLLRSYKKVKRYMRSSIYDVKKMDGTETMVSDLLDKYYDPDV